MDKTKDYSKKDISENKGIACFAYFGLLFVMPLWGASDSQFARFHANQGMVLFINELILCILILASHALVLLGVIPEILRVVRTLLILFLYIMMFFYIAFGVTNTIRGKAKELPLIGGIRIVS